MTMRTIWKYSLERTDGPQTLVMPECAVVYTVASAATTTVMSMVTP